MKWFNQLRVYFLGWAFLVLVASVSAATPTPLALGNPSKAAKVDPDNFLIVRPGFTISYNASLGRPNWVAWVLRKGDFSSTAPREGDFFPEKGLPKGAYRVVSRDFSGSGFDRGHLCPNGDRNANPERALDTFRMSNIMAQTPSLNRYAWNQMEVYLRSLAEKGSTVYIFAGPIGEGGVGSKGEVSKLANGKISVPKMCWKVAVIVPPGSSQVGSSARVLAAVMPNDSTPTFEWGHYRTSVAAIEAATKLSFFSALSSQVASGLRKQVDSVELPAPVEPAWYKEWKAKLAEKKASGDLKPEDLKNFKDLGVPAVPVPTPAPTPSAPLMDPSAAPVPVAGGSVVVEDPASALPTPPVAPAKRLEGRALSVPTPVPAETPKPQRRGPLWGTPID